MEEWRESGESGEGTSVALYLISGGTLSYHAVRKYHGRLVGLHVASRHDANEI